MQSCFDSKDLSGVAHAQRRLDVWAKKRETVSGHQVSVVKAAVAARVPGFQLHTRPPYEDLAKETAKGLMRWVANNDDVRRERQNEHIRRVSTELSDVYQRAWNNAEVAGLELLFKQLSASEDRLLCFLEKAKQQRAELNGRSIMNASAGESEAAKLLSNVMDARRKLEEDAEGRGSTASVIASGLQARFQEAKAVAEKSQEHLSNLNGLIDASVESDLYDSGDDFVDDIEDFQVSPMAGAFHADPVPSSPPSFPPPAGAGDGYTRGNGYMDGDGNGNGNGDGDSFTKDDGYKIGNAGGGGTKDLQVAHAGEVRRGAHASSTPPFPQSADAVGGYTSGDNYVGGEGEGEGDGYTNGDDGYTNGDIAGRAELNDEHTVPFTAVAPTSRGGSGAAVASEGAIPPQEKVRPPLAKFEQWLPPRSDVEMYFERQAMGTHGGAVGGSDQRPAPAAGVAERNATEAVDGGVHAAASAAAALGRGTSSESMREEAWGGKLRRSDSSGGGGARVAGSNGYENGFGEEAIGGGVVGVPTAPGGENARSAADSAVESLAMGSSSAAATGGHCRSEEAGGGTDSSPFGGQLPSFAERVGGDNHGSGSNRSPPRGGGAAGVGGTTASPEWATPYSWQVHMAEQKLSVAAPTEQRPGTALPQQRQQQQQQQDPPPHLGDKNLPAYSRATQQVEPQQQVPQVTQQQRPQQQAEPMADFTKGPTYDGRDYRSATSTPRFGRHLPEDNYDNRHGSEKPLRPQKAQASSPGPSPAERAMAASRARESKAGFSGGGGNGANAELQQPPRSVFGGRATVQRGGDGVVGQTAVGAQSSIKKKRPLPTPRYGRYIPEGSPPKAPTTLSADYPFRASPTSPARQPPSRQNPYQRHPHQQNALHWKSRGQGHERLPAGFGGGGSGAGGAGGGGRNGHSGGGLERGGAASADGRGVQGGAENLGGFVDDFRAKENETFFKSKGIEGDVDSFNWDELRRNTQEIEKLQKAAVDRYWRRQGVDPNDRR